MKYILLAILFSLLLMSCSMIDDVGCFGIDGKAYSSCKRKIRATKSCESDGGLKSYSYNFAQCNNDNVFENID